MSTIRPVTPLSGKQPPFGLVAWLEKTQLHLPLKGVECRFDVCGDVVEVEIDQVFYQSAEKPLECLYSFPLPAGATVHRCEMHVNDRVIRARVEEEKAAREVYEQKKAEGRRAALVETVRDNFFTLTLGNIQPGDVVVMRFAYFQTVERDPASQLSIRVPVCPGVRYIPGKPLLRDLTGAGTADDTDQVPDASRISPPRIDALHPDAAYFCINGRIDRSIADLATIASPTHRMFLRESDTAYLAGLADGSAVPDRDFVLRWNEPAIAAPTPLAWTYRENDATYALVQLRAPAIEKASDDYEQDFYFLLDRSGSMQGAKWVKTCEALKAFIRLLGPGDRAWITFFESNFCDFAEVPMSPAAIAREKAFKNIERLGVAGGTVLLPALRHVLEKVDIHSPDRNASILLLTDGQVGNEKGVLDCMAARPGLKVHTFGIDTAVNDAFLKQLASRQRGQCFLQTPNDDIAGMVARLGARLRRPVLTGISEGSGNWELASGTVPDLFSNEIIDISAWSKNHAASITFSGSLPDGSAHTLRITPLAVNNRAVLLLCIRARIETLIAAGDKEQAITLARTYNILCEGASFVAWDDAGQVSIGSDTIYQPSLEQSVLCAAAGLHMRYKDMDTTLGAP
ncbi:MAG TPA: VIT domain-containing protein, partial [Chthoniobacteraceae bacterium]|nr:VIT domain-containing protein [Chthoniobacteraceae bacterium]